MLNQVAVIAHLLSEFVMHAGGGDEVGEEPSSTSLNLCSVLGMLGRHEEALLHAQEAADVLTM